MIKTIKNIKRDHAPDLTVRCLGPAAAASLGNERGMALILALVMLTLLGILGVWALDNSTTDLKISGNFRTTQYAFYAADGGIGYTTNPYTLPAVYNFNGGNAGWISNPINVIASGPVTGPTISASFTASVPSLLQGPLPPTGSKASIYDADVGGSGWHGVYTAATSTGTAANNAVVVVEAVVAQAVPN